VNLPKALCGHAAELERALSMPLYATWPEDVTYATADQAVAIAGVLIGVLHQHLSSARMAFLFKKSMVRGEKVRLAHVGKASAKLAYLADLDFVIDLNWTAWSQLTDEQRVALVDHELCHCGVDPDTSKWVMLEHDVEEFGQIVRRWGFWQPDLQAFAGDVRAQLDLLEARPARSRD
jgi:hypothetical protein